MSTNTTVSPKWLQENINNTNLVLLDASLPNQADGTPSEYPNLTIATAHKFDLNKVFKNISSEFPNTAPTPQDFASECQKLGINQDSQIVVFDNFGVYSSPRVWWLFQLMGHKNIAVLDGGLPAWIEQGFAVAEIKEMPTDPKIKGDFKADYQAELLISFDDVRKNVCSPTFTIVDARSSARFNGTAPEPRTHLQSGHIENSINIPYQAVLNGYKFKNKIELQEIFNQCYFEENTKNNLVFSCGSGMTACIIMLAYEQIVDNKRFTSSKKVYDGSWTEWAELNKLYI